MKILFDEDIGVYEIRGVFRRRIEEQDCPETLGEPVGLTPEKMADVLASAAIRLRAVISRAAGHPIEEELLEHVAESYPSILSTRAMQDLARAVRKFAEELKRTEAE